MEQKTAMACIGLVALLGLTAPQVHAESLQKTARCSGLLIGQAIGDLYFENEAVFRDGVTLALLGYYGTLNADDYSEAEISNADRVLNEATDFVISAINENSYGIETFEETRRCYTTIAMSIYENHAVLVENRAEIDDAVEVSVNALLDTFGRDQ